MLNAGEAEALLLPWLRPAEGDDCPAILAVSGGPDSICLMRSAARLVGIRPLHVATVDHGLRPASAGEADQVAAWATGIGLPHRVLRWDGEKPATRLQERARDERHRLLLGFAREVGASCILTAHTLDDQIETILLRFLKGSGFPGLKGMSAIRTIEGVILARPFLAIRKSRLVATCTAEGWPFLDDPSNRDPRFARARLRRWLPDLEREGFSPERFALFAQRMARADAALVAAADSAFAEARVAAPAGAVALDAARFSRLPEEVAIRVLDRAVAGAVPRRRQIRLERLERLAAALVAGGRGGTIAGAQVTLRPDGKLVVRPEPARRRGRYPGTGGRGASLSGRDDDAAPPHSLGKGEGHA